jgi:tetratricopeptide (TPR) repeat protein
LGINAALPSWAHKVNRNGLENFDNKRIESAKADFQRAIAMRPNYGEAYYNLGWLYEELNDLDKAKAQYEVAVQSDPQRFDSGITYVKALNNLGRLYILKKEYGTAVHLLRKGFDRFNDLGLQDRDGKNMSKEQRDVYYSLYKNLGWARLMQESYDVAEARLKMAIKIDTNRSSAHCLLAQVVDAKFPQEPAKSLDLWRTCIAVVTPRDLAKPEEDEWSALANKRIEKILSGKEVKKE